jgi:hypothetical protein
MKTVHDCKSGIGRAGDHFMLSRSCDFWMMYL